MTRFDRYVLSQLMVLFGFFALVLVLIFWINKAVRMFDRLIGDGQTAWVFLEFTALTLPSVIGLILPVAAFAATVYVTNRLSTESELMVMQATGHSPWRLIRPVFLYGVLIAVLMSLLTHILIPGSLSQLRLRKAEVNRNITSKLLTEGEFLHPAPGITFYIRDISPEGELNNVFLSDRRNPESPVIFTSSKAYLVSEGNSTKLVMVYGLAQNLHRDGNRLFTTQFDDFAYDISNLISKNSAGRDLVTLAGTPELLFHHDTVVLRTGASDGALMVELHTRFTQALMCLIAALIGFATLLQNTYSRFGIWWQIVAAFSLLVVIKLFEGLASGLVIANAAMWPFLYLPVFVGALLTALMLSFSARPGFVRKRLMSRPTAEGTV